MKSLMVIQARATRLMEIDAEIARAEDAGYSGECILLYMEQEENLRDLLRCANRVCGLSRPRLAERFRRRLHLTSPGIPARKDD